MRIEPFEMERWQSEHEHHVRWNLSDSSVHPLTVAELLALPATDGAPSADSAAVLDGLCAVRLGYPQTNGSELLRARIAALYPGAGPEHVLVTHGGAEANLLCALQSVTAGNEVLVLTPAYMQLEGLARSLGASVRTWRAQATRAWRPDPAELAQLVGPRTRLIVVTTPINPTGRILDEETLDAVAAAAERVGAWVLSDEIYRGAELTGPEAPSLWGRLERLFVTSGLSKAYGLPGLRLGWIASPRADAIAELWGVKDYTSISDSPVTMALAAHALEPACRRALLARTRSILARNLPTALAWTAAQPGLDALAPEAGAILWVRLPAPVSSAELAQRLLVEERALVLPGEHFREPGHLRLGFGGEPAELSGGLEALGRVLGQFAAPARG